MIFIHPAYCDRCGISLMIYPGIQDGPGATGDLYLELVDGQLTATAQCKSIVICDENLARKEIDRR
jgi:hypothetical protein